MKPLVKKEIPSCSTSEETSSQRPKRSTCQKNLDGSNGLLWREENDLKRALYASLQETRRKNLDDDEVEDSDGLKTPPMEEPLNEQEEILKKAKVHAQRKFAQGSNPNSPLPTPQKAQSVSNSTTELLPYRRPKTEDFLTFLCLRGTSILPPSLDFLNCCSKSDSSSECRSLSPDLEIKDCSDSKENGRKASESRDRGNLRHEGLANGVSRKFATCKASSKRHPDSSSHPVKKSSARIQKEVSVIKKRKSRDEGDDVEFIPSKSVQSRGSVNGRTRSSTLHALKEKYKKQRMAADKKKLLPPKQASQPSSKTTTRSQGAGKDKAAQHTPKALKSSPPVVNKVKQTQADKKLAVEKRKSLRSAHVSRSSQRKLLGSNKKTLWSRRAKLVPPIVDVDSDSEPEIISSSDVKRTSHAVPNKHASSSSSGRLSERLRPKTESVKETTKLTSRQILLRKHMQNRLKAKKSAVHSQNIKSKTINKKTSRQILKKVVKKNLTSKTMSLRKDLQNKRVTRSAKHQIEEMLWSNPEKKTKLPSSKTVPARVITKRASVESLPSSKRPKLNLRSKTMDSKNGNSVEKEVKVKPTGDSNKATQSSVQKSVKKVSEPVKVNRGSKIASSTEPKPCSSSSSDSEILQNKTKVENVNKPLDHKVSKPSETVKTTDKKGTKSSEEKTPKTANKGNKPESQVKITTDIKKPKLQNSKPEVVENKLSKPGCSKNLNPLTQKSPLDSKGGENLSKLNAMNNNMLKNTNVNSLDSEKHLKSLNKDTLNLKKDNSVGDNSKFPKNKETNVQNNLNCLKSDKNINKDISQLISLNVECEKSVSVPYSEPGCSNIGREEKIKKLNVEKVAHISPDSTLAKKHNDKKYLKNASCKLDKSLKKVSEKIPPKDIKDKSIEDYRAKIKENNYRLIESMTSDSEASLDIDTLATFRNIPSTSKGESSKHLTGSNISPINDLSGSSKKDLVNKCNIDVMNCSNLKDTNDRDNKGEHKKDVKKQKTEQKEKCDKSGNSNLKKDNSNIVKNKASDIRQESVHNTPKSSYQINELSDDDSDYDITLDQLLKMKTGGNVSETSSEYASSSTEPSRAHEPKVTNSGKDSKSVKKELEKEAGKSKKEGESSKHKKDKESSKSKSHDKSTKKEEKLSRKDAEKSLAKLLKRERSKSNRKEDKEKLKHKRDGSSSSKSSKRELEKDGSKLNKKDSEKEGTSFEKKTDSKTEFAEKKEKSSKKDSSKLSRSNSCDDSKSPKKKKKFNEFKDIEKIKNLISNSSILNEVSGFKEFKRRLSSDKSELKKLKSKKRKKLALLKDKKLSKKLSSKLLRKYSKKKELKKKKLKKKEMKKDKTGESSKVHSKNKKQKHKDKEHHRRESLDKKNLNATPHSILEATANLSLSGNLLALSKSTGTQHQIHQKLESVTSCVQTSVSNIVSPLTNSTGTSSIEAKLPSLQDSAFPNSNGDSSFASNSLNSTSGKAFSKESALLTTKSSVAQVPLHFIQDTTPKTMTDAATNTCEDDLDESLSPIPEHLRSDEMSVGTQTITPVGSPSPVELCPVVPPPVPLKPLPTATKCIAIQGTSSAKQHGVLESPMIHVPYTLLHKSLTPVVLANPQLVTGSPAISASNIVNKTNIFPLSPVKNEMIVPVQNLVKVELKKDFPPRTIPTTVSPRKQVPFTTSPMLTQSKATVTKIVHISTIPAESRKVCPPPSVLTPVPMKPKVLSISKPPSDITPSPVKCAPPNPLNMRRSSEGTSAPVASTSSVTAVKPKTSLPEGVPSTSETVTSPKVVQSSSPPTQSSPKAKKRNTSKKPKTPECLPKKQEPFPLDTAKMVSAPVFYPTAEEFSDPLDYINKIRSEAEQYGICKIVPPSTFKPECKVNDDMRFTAYNQYLHKMLYRWGPNVQHTACIKKHLKTQKVKLEQAPLIGGIELDISKFYHKVQQLGGLQQVIEKKKWQKVADAMRVPKTAQDRVTKLYDAYCKYLVSYDALPSEDKRKLEEEVLADHEKRLKIRNSANEQEKEEDFDDEENLDCVTRGRSMSLSNFFRIARNTMSMWFKNEPSPDEVEHELWKIVTEREQHVVVHVGNIDSAVTQSGFPTSRSSFAKHPWNLKILTNNSKSVLKSMGPISGITIPTLHVGMLFTTGCWYRDPHSCAWIEYLHTGASKIWYGVPANGCDKFRGAMKKIMPEYCSNRPLWLSVDTAMVPPDLLVKHGASLSRTIQSSGQFVVIFPGSYTSSICCGYSVSESVYFAPISWLDIATKAFQDIRNSCESPAFALEKLLFSIGNDPKPQLKVLEKILPMVESIRLQELNYRAQLNELGLKQFERLPVADVRDKKKKSKTVNEENDFECDICHTPCYISMVVYPQEDSVYCPAHAIEHIEKKNFKLCKLQFAFSENDLNELVKKVTDLVSTLPNSTTVKKKSPKKKTAEK